MRGFSKRAGTGLVPVLALVLGLWAAPTAEAQPGAGPGPMHPGSMGQMTPEQQRLHEQMMTEMQARQQKLDDLVKKMNAATGPEKVDAIAAVVNELVAQRGMMRSRMWQMHEQRMKQTQPGAPTLTDP
jgi:hypothetical protein